MAIELKPVDNISPFIQLRMNDHDAPYIFDNAVTSWEFKNDCLVITVHNDALNFDSFCEVYSVSKDRVMEWSYCGFNHDAPTSDVAPSSGTKA